MGKRLYFLARAVLLLLVIVLLPLFLGHRLSLSIIPTPQVAVIRIQGDIWGSYTAYLSQALEEVGQDPAVRAVVLSIVSPGGEVSASEGLYFDVLKLREKKPVVASVGEMAASGAYYVAAAADKIYAKPGSMVGSIGVVAILPANDFLDEQLVTTGPFKRSGGAQEAYVRQLEALKETFIAAIQAQRGDRLQVGQDVLSRAEIYLGLQAQQMGLVDTLGSESEAIVEAARMAHIRNYRIVDRTPVLPEFLGWYARQQANAPRTAATVAAPPDNLPPGLYYRYVEPLQ